MGCWLSLQIFSGQICCRMLRVINLSLHIPISFGGRQIDNILSYTFFLSFLG